MPCLECGHLSIKLCFFLSLLSLHDLQQTSELQLQLQLQLQYALDEATAVGSGRENVAIFHSLTE